jgi:hypothetical protein
MVAPLLLRYCVAMALFAMSYLLMNYFLSVNKTKIAYALLITMIVQVSSIILFHDNITTVVNVILGSSILGLLLILPFFLGMRRLASDNQG